MITNAPTHVLVAQPDAPPAGDRLARLVAWLSGRLQQALCSLHGHDAVLQYERTRIFLRCTSCGYESPGWEVAQKALLRHRPLTARPALSAPADLTVARRIA
jgi:hypothetical protein